MIKNDRQYKITKSHVEDFTEVVAELERLEHSAERPRFWKTKINAARSQLQELQEELAEYEALKQGHMPVLRAESISELPVLLIRARIASGMSQKELAERLGMKEQQIQRYEATDYQGASLARLQEVMEQFKLLLPLELPVDNRALSLSRFLKRIHSSELGKFADIERIFPRDLIARIQAQLLDEGGIDFLVLKAAEMVSRIFSWDIGTVLGNEPLTLNRELLARTHFRVSKRANVERLTVFTIYANYIARLVLKATIDLPQKPIPPNPEVVRAAILSQYGAITLANALNYVWSLGIPVLALEEIGAFNGACWREDGRNVIVLKQNTTSESKAVFNLLHELRHAAERPHERYFEYLEAPETSSERMNSQIEETATIFAGDVMLEGRAEHLTDLVMYSTKGDLRFFKANIQRIAENEDISAAALANYIAFRLAAQGEDFWGTANTLQGKKINPFEITRDILLQHIDLDLLDRTDREILLQAISN